MLDEERVITTKVLDKKAFFPQARKPKTVYTHVNQNWFTWVERLTRGAWAKGQADKPSKLLFGGKRFATKTRKLKTVHTHVNQNWFTWLKRLAGRTGKGGMAGWEKSEGMG